MQFCHERNEIHLANLLDLWHLKNAELAKPLKIQRVELCCGVTTSKTKKDTEQYSHCKVFQSLRWKRQKFLDSVSKLPGVAGETSDVVSAYTQVKMTKAPRLLRLPKEECSEIWIKILSRQRPRSWDNIDDPVVPLGRNLYDHPLASFLWGKQFTSR